jgi:hypothetical protein
MENEWMQHAQINYVSNCEVKNRFLIIFKMSKHILQYYLLIIEINQAFYLSN